jgi:hypothetical protein
MNVVLAASPNTVCLFSTELDHEVRPICAMSTLAGAIRQSIHVVGVALGVVCTGGRRDVPKAS